MAKRQVPQVRKEDMTPEQWHRVGLLFSFIRQLRLDGKLKKKV